VVSALLIVLFALFGFVLLSRHAEAAIIAEAQNAYYHVSVNPLARLSFVCVSGAGQHGGGRPRGHMVGAGCLDAKNSCAILAILRLPRLAVCVQFARGKSHINGIETFRFCTFRAPLAGAAK